MLKNMRQKMTMLKKNGILAIIDLIVVLIVSYCIIRYTKTMKETPSCNQIKPDQREFLAYGGILMLSHVILSLILRGIYN
uniref:Uncharacterized protein n=1 Tax=viral metagenome TaxID=1070528 RepID=A0A6C0BW15_9ZZZZ